MPIHHHRAALRHGISHERSAYVIEHCRNWLYSEAPEDADVVLFLGFDQQGVALEVIAIEIDDGTLLVIHAMKLRPQYRIAFREVTTWREH